MSRPKVAVVRVTPDKVLEGIDRVHELAGVESALDKGATTILKDNISWHFPFPAANTTPWQLEGTIRALRARGYRDQSCVQNKTVVTNAFKGEDLNRYVPVFRQHEVPVKFNFRDMKWEVYKPKAKMLVLDHIYPEGIQIPDYFVGKNIVHLPTVKCVAGETEIMLDDGTLTTIGELVNAKIAAADCVALERDGASHAEGSARIMAMGPDGRVQPFEAVRFARSARNGRAVLRLRTRTGRQLIATADHPVRTPDGWTPLGELRPGSRVAMARRLIITGRPQQLPQTHAAPSASAVTARPGRKYTAEFNQRIIDTYQGGTAVTAIAVKENVRWQVVQQVLKRHEVRLRRNVAQLAIPDETSPGFWRWVGYFMAEGCVGRGGGCDKLWWINSDETIRSEYVSLTKELFSLPARVRANGAVYSYSRDMGRFLEELDLPIPLNSGNKRVPPILYRCSDEEVAAFLSAYLDGDGHVNKRQAEVSATTKSLALARGLQVLFARLGVAALVRPYSVRLKQWTEARTYHKVTVAGASLLPLASLLTLRHPEKRRRLAEHAERLATSKQPSNWDVVPLRPESMRVVREGLGLTHATTGMGPAVNKIENGPGHVTGRIARALLDVFAAQDTGGRFSSEIAALHALASEDLAWDEVEELSPVEGEIDLYDVTVPGADSFVANGLIVHNCHIYTTTTGAMKNAFGGLLNTKRHYTHSWIHKTLVDLLAIQKEIHAGLFAVMDGTTAGDGPGPRTMRPVIKNVMLASADQVAIDAVAAKMMGFDPMSIEYIGVAHEQGLGKGRLDEIELVGDVDAANERWGFSVGDNGASRVGDLMWFGPLKRFQKLFFHTPLVNVFVMGSELYHDYYRWPLRDKAIFDKWRAETGWGQLFDRYGAEGTLAAESKSGSRRVS